MARVLPLPSQAALIAAKCTVLGAHIVSQACILAHRLGPCAPWPCLHHANALGGSAALPVPTSSDPHAARRQRAQTNSCRFDASLTAQCPDAIGKTPATRKCLVQHLVDLDRGCLAEISELIQKKMARGGSGGDLRPLPRPMDGFSTGGIGSEEFDLEGDFSGPRAPSDIDWEQPGRFTGGFTPVHAALVGAIAAVLSMFVVKCLQRSCFRRRCPKFHHHPHPQPPPPPAPHAQREHIAMPLLAEPQAHKV